MSAEKGGALVRSPPSIYSHQAVGWGGPNSALTSSHPHRPIRATVTKISSGDSSKTNKYEFAAVERKMQSQELDQSCGCGGWSKAKQLSHDLIQLRSHHDSILKGLFEEVEELKRKNSDLTFTLLMGPTTAQLNDLNVSTDAQTAGKMKEVRSTSQGDIDLKSLTITGKTIGHNQALARRESKDRLRKSSYDQNSTESIKTRSSTIEWLEEEMKDAKRQLEEERRKNEYLWRVVDELKRQLAEAKNSRKEIKVGNNFKSSPVNLLDKGRTTQSVYAGSSYTPVKPLYLPAIVKKQNNQEHIEKHVTTSFANTSNVPVDKLKNSMLRKSCPTLPSINSSNDSFTKYPDKDDTLENQANIDNSGRPQTMPSGHQDVISKERNIPRGKRSSKKERIAEDSIEVTEDLSEHHLKHSDNVESIQNSRNLVNSSSTKASLEFVTGQDSLIESGEVNAPIDGDYTRVECVTLGNTISIVDTSNNASSSNEQFSVLPKTKSKGRRSGRNKKRKNVLLRNDSET